jgi:hypothetical protein
VAWSAEATTRAPAASAAAAVPSVEWSSTTRTSSSSGTLSTRAARARSTIVPTVAASSRAGRQSEIRWSPFASTSAGAAKASWWYVRTAAMGPER